MPGNYLLYLFYFQMFFICSRIDAYVAHYFTYLFGFIQTHLIYTYYSLFQIIIQSASHTLCTTRLSKELTVRLIH